MRILLDTFFLYRFMEAPRQLFETDLRYFDDNETQIHVSAVSIWEMRLKHHARYRSGGRKSPYAPGDVLLVLEEQDVRFLPISMSHAARELDVPIAHNDPFDELLLVQAQEEDLKLLTADRQMIGHPLAIAVQQPARRDARGG